LGFIRQIADCGSVETTKILETRHVAKKISKVHFVNVNVDSAYVDRDVPRKLVIVRKQI
jgi:hypothetical protein